MAHPVKLPSLAVAFTIAVVGVSCSDGGRDDVDTAAARPDAGVPHAAELEAAALDIVAFLRGAAPFDDVSLDDSVVLYVSPEGGGARTVFERGQLRDPAAWVVRSGGRSHALAPPPGLTTLTTSVGRHFNCLEYPLSSRFEALGQLPHVGVKLEPEAAESCLQTWNVTFVFDSAARPLRLVAAVYDQWEW
ncbi:MAG TPA: hypothetical protein VMM18_05580 [Gemmatimonadaceae bacterium]|nr:hypothetical protein [Gemmatimonadaceae bacterium]